MKSLRDIELWAITVLDQVSRGIFREDSLVELKRELPSDYYKIARRIAGHCNAARGQTVLWIVGADEQAGVTGWQAQDLATVLPQVWKHFEGETPIASSLSIEFDGAMCTAIAIDSERSPYLVKNPLCGNGKGNVIEREIPWRDGTRIRTARRDEVMRLLIDYSSAPELEIFDSKIFAAREDDSDKKDGIAVAIQLNFYLMPRSVAPLVIPIHRIEVELFDVSTGNELILDIERFHFSSKEGQLKSIRSLLRGRGSISNHPSVVVQSDRQDSVMDTGSEFIVNRAAYVEMTIRTRIIDAEWEQADIFRLRVSMYAGIDRIPIHIDIASVPK